MNQKAEGLVQVAWYYREGESVEKNRDLAIQLYNKAIQIDPSFGKAYYGLGWCYFDENDLEKNKQQWFPLFQKAAELGYSSAQYYMGYYYEENRMYQESLKWYGMAAAQDDTDSIYRMIFILAYEEDTGVTDYQKAFALMHKAYDLKADWAAYELGYAYSKCKDESLRDHNKAMKYFKEAALKGSGEAAYYVGRAYVNGEGVPKDMPEAIVWLKYAADHGDEDALKNLAAYYSSPAKHELEFSKEDTVAILEKGSDVSCAYCYGLMKDYEKGKYGTVDHDKANAYCAKFFKIRNETGEELNIDAKQGLIAIRNNRSLHYAMAFAKWSLIPDTEIKGKMAIIDEFEKIIEEESDINSLRTLACIRAGLTDIPRYNCTTVDENTGAVTKVVVSDAPAEKINSVPVEGILDYKKAFELLDKGVAWGDEYCKNLIRKICQQKVQSEGVVVSAAVDKGIKIEKATLLSLGEFNSNKDIINIKYGGCMPFWALLSVRKDENFCAYDVIWDGTTSYCYAGVSFDVRPALVIKDCALSIQSKIKYAGIPFTVLRGGIALCDENVNTMSFWDDKKRPIPDVTDYTLIYEQSDMKKWLDDWFGKNGNIAEVME